LEDLEEKYKNKVLKGIKRRVDVKKLSYIVTKKSLKNWQLMLNTKKYSTTSK